MKTVTSLNGYRELLREFFPGKGELRGQRKILAETLGCQTAFLSLVMTDKCHMSEEMFLETCDFLKFQKDEIEFALLLYHRERSGSQKLESYYTKKIEYIRKTQSLSDLRLQQEHSLPENVMLQYYSYWLTQAIHISTTLIGGITQNEICKLFIASEKSVSESLEFLCSVGLVKKNQGKFFSGHQRIHLSKESPMASLSHRSWRSEIIRQLHNKSGDHLHFSSIYSLSKSDYRKIKKIMENAILSSDTIVSPSKEEELCFLGIDLIKYAR